MAKASIVNNLVATVAGSVLDATQGKTLNDAINKLNTPILLTWIDQTNTTGVYVVIVTNSNIGLFQSGNAVDDCNLYGWSFDNSGMVTETN